MAKFLAFGEIMLRLSPPGRELLLQTPKFDVWVAGAEANVATALAKLGHDVGFGLCPGPYPRGRRRVAGAMSFVQVQSSPGGGGGSEADGGVVAPNADLSLAETTPPPASLVPLPLRGRNYGLAFGAFA